MHRTTTSGWPSRGHSEAMEPQYGACKGPGQMRAWTAAHEGQYTSALQKPQRLWRDTSVARSHIAGSSDNIVRDTSVVRSHIAGSCDNIRCACSPQDNRPVEAERYASAAAGSRSDVGAKAGGSRLQAVVRPRIDARSWRNGPLHLRSLLPVRLVPTHPPQAATRSSNVSPPRTRIWSSTNSNSMPLPRTL